MKTLRKFTGGARALSTADTLGTFSCTLGSVVYVTHFCSVNTASVHGCTSTFFGVVVACGALSVSHHPR